MPAFFPKTLYKARARIEQAVGKLKRFKRIALRCAELRLMPASSQAARHVSAELIDDMTIADLIDVIARQSG